MIGKLGLWGESHHDIKVRREFACLGILEWREIDDDGFLGFGILDPAQYAIGVIFRLSLDLALGGKSVVSLDFDGDMYVRRAAGIGDGFDGAEYVFARAAGEESTESLEIFIVFVGPIALRVDVHGVVVHLPNFDQRVADWFAFGIHEFAGKPGDFADAGCDGVVDGDQIVVGIQWQSIRVKWSFCLSRRLLESLCKCARSEKQSAGGGEFLEDFATGNVDVKRLHGGSETFFQRLGKGEEYSL